MEHLKVTLTHKATKHCDSDIVSPYNPAAKKEQANTLEKKSEIEIIGRRMNIKRHFKLFQLNHNYESTDLHPQN